MALRLALQLFSYLSAFALSSRVSADRGEMVPSAGLEEALASTVPWLETVAENEEGEEHQEGEKEEKEKEGKRTLPEVAHHYSASHEVVGVGATSASLMPELEMTEHVEESKTRSVSAPIVSTGRATTAFGTIIERGCQGLNTSPSASMMQVGFSAYAGLAQVRALLQTPSYVKVFVLACLAVGLLVLYFNLRQHWRRDDAVPTDKSKKLTGAQASVAGDPGIFVVGDRVKVLKNSRSKGKLATVIDPECRAEGVVYDEDASEQGWKMHKPGILVRMDDATDERGDVKSFQPGELDRYTGY